MKQIFILIIMVFIFDISQVNAQNTKPTITKSELDELYKEYKNMNSITIYTSNKNVTGNIKITLNSDSLPEAIEISGVGDRFDIAEIFYNLIQKKKAKGYLLYQGDNYELGISPKGIEYIAFLMDNNIGGSSFNAVYKKGTMFFKLMATKQTSSYLDFNLQRQVSTYHTFSMINEDYARKGNNKKTDFKF